VWLFLIGVGTGVGIERRRHDWCRAAPRGENSSFRPEGDSLLCGYFLVKARAAESKAGARRREAGSRKKSADFYA